MAYIDIFKKNDTIIRKLGEEKAHIVWVMARYLDESDLEALAAAALTDGPNDKKIDFIHLDHDAKTTRALSDPIGSDKALAFLRLSEF